MKKISHDFNEESIEAKVRWFRALPLSEKKVTQSDGRIRKWAKIYANDGII